MNAPLINRELSALAFNERVLALARDQRVPLLERWRFLCICSSNLDEFFEIRVAGLKQLQDLGSAQRSSDGLSPEEQLAQVHEAATRLVASQYRCLNEELLPQLEQAGIVFPSAGHWDRPTRAWLLDYFKAEVEPVLSPLALDPARPFPRIQNKSLNFLVRLEGHDAFEREATLAVVQVPRSLPRLIKLPARARQRFVALSTLVDAFMPRLFHGIAVRSCHQFRVTRNSELFVDEEEVDDLRRALEGELVQRRYGAAVRLETDSRCPLDLVETLRRQFLLGESDSYSVPGPVNLNRLSTLHEMVQRAELKYPPFAPGLPARLRGSRDLFAAIRRGEVLLHHPYQDFSPILGLLRAAAEDAKVLAVKQTLYRTGSNSPIVDLLVQAARAGKDVTVIIELRARFDEQANIELSTRLQEAGAHVMFGVVGFKTHAKLLMIVRREVGQLRRYCHLGTGNYHPGTARAYTDYGLLTCDAVIGRDIHETFLQLTGLTRAPAPRRLILAPFRLHEAIMESIEHEAECAREGRAARIVAKMNALVDPRIIAALSRASCLGVKIDLIVRGICCLRPGVPAYSENVRVISILGRFLEHSRVFWFRNGGRDQLLLSSADWMERNFYRRVEVAVPIRNVRLRQQILAELELLLADTAGAWRLRPDGSYVPLRQADSSTERDSQAALLQRYAATGVRPE